MVLIIIYFTSDLHFCHSNIIKLSKRPFKNVEEMNNTLVQNWNSCISDDDEVYVLGDFSYRGSVQEVNTILKKLKGKKYLIKGNHDGFINDKAFDSKAFEWIRDYHILSYKEINLVLFHYPILEWQGFFGDSLHLYGHVHNSTKDEKQRKRLDILGSRAINVGVDVNDYHPISIERLIKKSFG